VVDNSVIKQRQRRRQLPSHKPKLGTKRRLQHLCLDKAYNSEPEEQELIKRSYVLHISYKKKKGEEVDEEKTKAIPNRKKHSPKRWVIEREQTLGTTGSGNYSHDMKRRSRTILDWYSYLVA
jgi:hypothetical protein